MTTYILENNSETVKWLLSRGYVSIPPSYDKDPLFLRIYSVNKHYLGSHESIIVDGDILVTLKEYQELEVLKALGITL